MLILTAANSCLGYKRWKARAYAMKTLWKWWTLQQTKCTGKYISSSGNSSFQLPTNLKTTLNGHDEDLHIPDHAFKDFLKKAKGQFLKAIMTCNSYHLDSKMDIKAVASCTKSIEKLLWDGMIRDLNKIICYQHPHPQS